MNRLLDTCILIDIANGNKAVIEELNVSDMYSPRPFITTATYSEYYYGFLSRIPKEQQKCVEFLENFNSVTLTKGSARRLAELNYKLKKAGFSFTTMDLFNAAIALEENLMFITSDRQFEKISELKKVIIPK